MIQPPRTGSGARGWYRILELNYQVQKEIPVQHPKHRLGSVPGRSEA